VVTPPQQEIPKEEPFTFVDCPKPPHIHDIMQAYDNKQNEPENVSVEEESVDEIEVVEEHNYYAFNQAPANDLSHYKVGWDFGELSGFKPHREMMTEEEKESNRLFMNLPGIRVNALYDTATEFRDPDNIFSSPRDAPYKYDPSVQGTFAEYGNLTEKPTYDVASDYGSENQSFVHEPSYMSETHESEADLDNYDLYGFSYLPNLKKKKSDSSMSITSETPSGHRRMSRRRSIASSISMDFEDYQFNKNTFGINDDDPYNYNGVIDDNFHDDLFEDVDVYDGMYMNQQEPYVDENASYNEEDLQTDGYFPEEFDELNKNKVTDTINITEVTNEITLPENKNTVVVSDTYITKHKEPPSDVEEIEKAPREAAAPQPVEPVAAAPREAAVPEPVEPVSASPKEAIVPEPKEAKTVTKKETKKSKKSKKETKKEPIVATPREAAVPEQSKSKTTTTTKTITTKKSPQEEVEVIEEIVEIPVEEKIQSKKKDVPITSAPREATVPESKKSKTSKSKITTTTKKTTTKTTTTKKSPQEEVEIIEEVIEIPVEEKIETKSREVSTSGSKKVIKKGQSGEEEEEVEIIEEVIEVPYDEKSRPKGVSSPDDEVEVIEEVIEVPYDQPDQQKLVSKKVTKQVLRLNPKTGKKEVVEETVDTSGKSESYDDAEEIEVTEEVVEVPYDQPQQQKLVSKKVTKQVNKVNPATGKKELVEVVEEPSIKPREVETSKPKQKKTSKKTTTTKKSPQEEVEIIEEVIEIPVEEKIETKSREVSTSGSKKVIKKGQSGEEEEEVEIIEEVIEVPYDEKSRPKGVSSPDDEVELVEEVIEVPYDQPDQQKLVSKKVTKQVLRFNPKTGKKEVVEETVDTSGKSESYDDAEEIEVTEEVVEVPYDQPQQQKLVSKKVTKQVNKVNPATGKKELVEVVEEPSVKPREASEKKDIVEPPSQIKYSTSKKVVTDGDSSAKEISTSTTKLTVVKKVVRKSPSGKVLEVTPESVPPSDTKVTRTIVIKNKDGEVVDTKTMEGSIDDVENRTNDLIGTGVVNVSDDRNHLSTKIRRTVIRKNANGEILSTESKNIENEESLENMKSISLLSLNKNKSTSNVIDQ